MLRKLPNKSHVSHTKPEFSGATEVQQPQVLRPHLLADELNLALAVPLRASDPPSSHPALDFDIVLMVVRDAPRHLAVPGVPVP